MSEYIVTLTRSGNHKYLVSHLSQWHEIRADIWDVIAKYKELPFYFEDGKAKEK